MACAYQAFLKNRAAAARIRTVASRVVTFSKPMLSEVRRPSIPKASDRVAARKKTQVRHTNWYVPKTAAACRRRLAGFFERPRQAHQARVQASITPWSRPQMAKVQVTPCQ